MNHLITTRRYTKIITFALMLTAVFAAGFAVGNHSTVSQAQDVFSPPADAEEAFAAFWQVYYMIEDAYIDDVDTSVLVDGAINGMVDALGDQYSGYMNPDIYPILNDDIDGSIEGIGAVIHTIEDTGEIEIVDVMIGSPAEAVGIKEGDIFYAVDGENVVGASQWEIVIKVRGRAGTTVNLTMKRGEDLVDFEVVRARVEVPNIESEVLDNNIGYIRLYEFNADARRQMDDALEGLEINSRNGLIIDLRGNPGGLLTSVVDVTSAFLEDGVILTEDFGGSREQIFRANGNYSGVTVPIVVLVNHSSASASELFSGALQDHGLATIIGETTLGKGTVQTWSDLVNGGGIRLTIARWLTPNGSWIHEKGITPDIAVEPAEDGSDADPQLDAAIDYLTTLIAEPQP